MTLTTQPRLWELFISMLSIGVQSFGGGSSTFYLIHETCLKRGWLTEEEFVRDWALAQVSPGINLLKLTILIGYKLRRWRGLAVAAAGLLLPSAAATALMTAGFAAIRGQKAVQAAMRGIMPATISLSLAMGFQMAWPMLRRAHREGLTRLGAHLVILVSAALLLGWAGISPLVVLLLAGAAAIPLLALVPVKAKLVAKDGPA